MKTLSSKIPTRIGNSKKIWPKNHNFKCKNGAGDGARGVKNDFPFCIFFLYNSILAFSGAYLYRKEQKKRLRHMSSSSSTETKLRCRGSSEDGSSCSAGGRDYLDDQRMSEGIRFLLELLLKLQLLDEPALNWFCCALTVHSPQPTTTTTTATTTTSSSSSSTMSSASAAAATPSNAASATGGSDQQQQQQQHQPQNALHHHHNDTESCSSSVESTAEEDRVFLQIGDQLRTALEHDWAMITKHDRLVSLPATIPVITILENFVKHYSVRAISCPSTQIADGTTRRRNSSAKFEKREKDYEKLNNSINLRKEVADGLRIYFDFTLRDYLLYRQERDQANVLLSEESLRNFTYVAGAADRQSIDLFTFKSDCADDSQPLQTMALAPSAAAASSSLSSNVPTGSGGHNNLVVTDANQPAAAEVAAAAEGGSLSAKRRLRSYKTEENEFIFDLSGATAAAHAAGKDCISSVASTSSGSSTPQQQQQQQTNNNQFQANMHLLKGIIPPNLSVSVKAKEMLQSILSWQIVPSDAPAQPSMIYGAVHLARLIGK